MKNSTKIKLSQAELSKFFDNEEKKLPIIYSFSSIFDSAEKRNMTKVVKCSFHNTSAYRAVANYKPISKIWNFYNEED